MQQQRLVLDSKPDYSTILYCTDKPLASSEKAVNKDTQTAGGTKGFSLKTGAVTRYYLTSENRSQYLRQLRNMTGNESTECFSHQDLQKPRIEKDKADVIAFVELMERS